MLSIKGLDAKSHYLEFADRSGKIIPGTREEFWGHGFHLPNGYIYARNLPIDAQLWVDGKYYGDVVKLLEG